jgi:hypothetical protein
VTSRLLEAVAGSLRALGIVGAVFLLIGPTLIGVGLANMAYAEGKIANCTSNCQSQDRDELNATIYSEAFFGFGLISIGVGGGLVFIAVTQFMSRWPPLPPPARL